MDSGELHRPFGDQFEYGMLEKYISVNYGNNK